ncbi:MAG: hypothetical protein JWO96_561 [Candidatus Saccharibacteria bacterium]|nr:hypothetical protein [Candidatus Saccharibacteria bacterium]
MADKTSDIVDTVAERFWWLGALQGILAIFFGITATVWPALTLVTLVYLFSAFILTVAIVEIIRGFTGIGRRAGWWMSLLTGFIGIGIYLVRHPNVSFATFILVVGIGLIARGLIELVIAFSERMRSVYRVLNVIAGLAAIAAGIVILLQPVAGGLAFVWILGLYGLIIGAMSLAVALDLHNQPPQPQRL